jgi:hypothetical protein
MTPARQSPLFLLPNEILLAIFHLCTSVKDAVSLARTCSTLSSIFSHPNNKIRVLQLAANAGRRTQYRPPDKPVGTLMRSEYLLLNPHPDPPQRLMADVKRRRHPDPTLQFSL